MLGTSPASALRLNLLSAGSSTTSLVLACKVYSRLPALAKRKQHEWHFAPATPYALSANRQRSSCCYDACPLRQSNVAGAAPLRGSDFTTQPWSLRGRSPETAYFLRLTQPRSSLSRPSYAALLAPPRSAICARSSSADAPYTMTAPIRTLLPLPLGGGAGGPRSMSSKANKRPRITITRAGAPANTAASPAPSPAGDRSSTTPPLRPATPPAPAPGSTSSAAPPAPSPTPPSASGQRPHPSPTHTSGLGQVIASAAKYVRVELHALLPEEAPTPPDWRPPHMRPRADPDRLPGPASSPGDAAPQHEAAQQRQPDGLGTPAPDTTTSHQTDTLPPATPAAGAAVDAASSSGRDGIAGGPGTEAAGDGLLVPLSSAGAPGPGPVVLCSVRALLRKLRMDVVVGDVVRVGSLDWVQGSGVVSEVLPRSSRLADPNVANVDHLLLVFALDQPPFEELQVSRFLVAAEAAGLPTTLVLNKADLVAGEVLERRVAQCRSWGYEPVVLSCERGEGVEQVASALEDRISAVAGPSGAGKSSLINCLRLGRHRPDLPADPRVAQGGYGPPDDNDSDLIELPPDLVRQYGDSSISVAESSGDLAAESSSSEEDDRSGSDGSGDTAASRRRRGSDSREVREANAPAAATGRSSTGASPPAGANPQTPEFLAVGELSRIGRGMHTTTAIRLLRLLGGGWLADTPGFGQPTLDDISSPQLASCFPEISSLLSESPCRFSDCLHVAEPGCAVRGAGLERYPHYLRFLQEIKTREAEDIRLVQRAKADREGYAKTKSSRGGGERLEARLDSKKHRRASRQAGKQAGRGGGEELD